MKPPRLCSCGSIIPHGELCSCQRARLRERNRRHDKNRPRASARGYNHEWRKARDEFLIRFPFCAMCSKPATLVDHVIPHKGNDALFWDRQNWQPLCKPCHDRHKQRKEQSFSQN